MEMVLDIKELWRTYWSVKESAVAKQLFKDKDAEFDFQAHSMCFNTFALQAEQSAKSGSISEQDVKHAAEHLQAMVRILGNYSGLRSVSKEIKMNLFRSSKEDFLRKSFSGVYAQDGFWIDKFDQVHKISEMDDDYKNNVIEFLLYLSKDPTLVETIEINGTVYSYGKEYYAIMNKIREFKESFAENS